MDSARRLSRWVTTNPVGAFTGTFAGLILLLLIGSIATHRLPGRAWLSVIEIFVPVSLCIGGAVWVQHSPWTSRIKPDWLSWGALAGLGLQLLVAGMFSFAILGNWFGFLHPLPGATPWPALNHVLSWSVLAIVAAVGIYRNRWWAYFFEIAVLWLLIAAMILDPSPPTPHHRAALEIPIMREIQSISEWAGFLLLNWHLIKRGLKGYREQKTGTKSP